MATVVTNSGVHSSGSGTINASGEGEADDIVAIFIQDKATDQIITPPAGFTHRGGDPETGIVLYTRTHVGGGEPANYTFTFAEDGFSKEMHLFLVRDGNTSDPVADFAPNAGNGTTATGLAVTAETSSSALACCIILEGEDFNAAAPAGMTLRVQNDFAPRKTWTQDSIAAGSTGNRTIALTGSTGFDSAMAVFSNAGAAAAGDSLLSAYRNQVRRNSIYRR